MILWVQKLFKRYNDSLFSLDYFLKNHELDERKVFWVSCITPYVENVTHECDTFQNLCYVRETWHLFKE